MIELMGHFTAIGMRESVQEDDALVINTCSDNDTSERGTYARWSWCNPTNRALVHTYGDVEAVSVECLWQGTKVFTTGGPDAAVLAGDWRRGKARRPVGAYAGASSEPLITSPGEARRRIYLPAYHNLISYWEQDSIVASWITGAREHRGNVYLRDFDTGRGVDRNGPMSHAWALACYLNTGRLPL